MASRKWKNQIADFQKATGEVFSDRLKCAIVLSRSPGPIRTYLRIQHRGGNGALRMASMNYLEAEDDSNGPVPMEAGAVKGSGNSGTKGKRDKESAAKTVESTTRATSTARTTSMKRV